MTNPRLRKTPKYVEFTEQELDKLLSLFSGWQQRKAIKFIAENPGIFTHEIHNTARTNNWPTIKAKTASRLLSLGYKVVNQIPEAGSQSKEERIFICHISEPEVLPVGESAND